MGNEGGDTSPSFWAASPCWSPAWHSSALGLLVLRRLLGAVGADCSARRKAPGFADRILAVAPGLRDLPLADDKTPEAGAKLGRHGGHHDQVLSRELSPWPSLCTPITSASQSGHMHRLFACSL